MICAISDFLRTGRAKMGRDKVIQGGSTVIKKHMYNLIYIHTSKYINIYLPLVVKYDCV